MMYHATLLVGACMAIVAMASSYFQTSNQQQIVLHYDRDHTNSYFLKYKTDHQARGVGYVRGGDSRFYFLDNTGEANVTHISHQLWHKAPIRPLCFHIEPLYTCSFYNLGIDDQGPLIGTFEGPAEGDFQEEYAAWYSCWGTGSLDFARENDRHWPRPLENKPCGALGFEPEDKSQYNELYGTRVYGQINKREEQ